MFDANCFYFGEGYCHSREETEGGDAVCFFLLSIGRQGQGGEIVCIGRIVSMGGGVH
jgi:hypothetical protein